MEGTKSVKPPVESEKPLRKPCGSLARIAEEKATLFANHLSEVFKPNPLKNNFSPPVIEEFLDNAAPVKVDLEDIKQIVKHQIKSKRSPGYDLITPEMIKNLPDIAFENLVKLFNAILKAGHYPTSWKISQIILIARPGKVRMIFSVCSMFVKVI